MRRAPVLIVLLISLIAQATTLTITPDATAGLDDYIYDYAPTNNYGTTDFIIIGNEGAVGRTLIQFDLSSLPSDAVISSATLSLYCITDGSSNARTFRVYRMKRSWVENGATWGVWDYGHNWTTAGGFDANECEQTDIGSRAFSATETLNEYKDFVLTPTTKAGLDLGYGWLLKADTETADGYQFRSSDYYATDPLVVPKLVIVYTTGGGGGTTSSVPAIISSSQQRRRQ
jgi:hypothetical protein